MFYVIVIIAAIFAMPAKADETLKFHYTAHLTAPAHFQEIDDVHGHTMGLAHLSCRFPPMERSAAPCILLFYCR
jgi:hypothetical protein